MRSTPFGGVLFVVACGVAIASGASPTTRSASRPASGPASQPAAAVGVRQNPRVTCAAIMHQLLFGAQLAVNETKGGLDPADLAAIFGAIDEYATLDPAAITCPSGHVARPPRDWSSKSHDDRVAWAVKHTAYVWSGGGLDSVKAITSHVDDVIIVLAEPLSDHPTHGGGMNLGFLDGHVAFVAAADLPAATAKSDAARATLLREQKAR